MKRRLFNIVAVLSLLLCVLTVASWGLSYKYVISFNGERGAWMLYSSTGAIDVGHSLPADPEKSGHLAYWEPEGLQYSSIKSLSVSRCFHQLWFGRSASEWGVQSGLIKVVEMHETHWRIPYWFPMLMFAVQPALWIIGWRRKVRKARAGSCVKCGYDLRASNERCPECGTPIVATRVSIK